MRRHDRPSEQQTLEAEKQEKLVCLLDRAGRKMEKLGEKARSEPQYDSETDAMTIPHD